MTIWIDAQLPPSIAPWLSAEFDLTAIAVRDIGLRDASDQEIYLAASESRILEATMPRAIDLLLQGERIIEIRA